MACRSQGETTSKAFDQGERPASLSRPVPRTVCVLMPASTSLYTEGGGARRTSPLQPVLSRAAQAHGLRGATSASISQSLWLGLVPLLEAGLELLGGLLGGHRALDDADAGAPQLVLQVRLAAREDLV